MAVMVDPGQFSWMAFANLEGAGSNAVSASKIYNKREGHSLQPVDGEHF